jgi:Terminase small subunit
VLQARLLAAFSGHEVSIGDVEKFVLVETAFRETHYKGILKTLEKNTEHLKVIKAPPGRRTGTFSAAIDRAIEVRAERTRITAHRVLLELARIAFADIGRIIDWSGNALTVKPPGMLSADDRAAISEIAVVVGKKGLAARVTLHDKERALEALCRHLGLFGHSGQFNAGTIESPSAAAARARAIIFERLAKLRAAREAEEQKEPDEGDAGGAEPQA